MKIGDKLHLTAVVADLPIGGACTSTLENRCTDKACILIRVSEAMWLLDEPGHDIVYTSWAHMQPRLDIYQRVLWLPSINQWLTQFTQWDKCF